MKGKKLTKRLLDAVRPGPRDLWLWDDTLKGFGAKVTPTGRRVFVVQYLAPGLHHQSRRVKIGEHGPTTVAQARAKAVALLGRVANGEDPARERVEARRAAEQDTVARLFEQYIEENRSRFKLKTLEAFESIGRLYIIPNLGKLPVARVMPTDVARLHASLSDRPAQANRVVSLVKSFYNWLERRRLFEGRNPARGIELYSESPRERFLALDELAKIGQALRVAETLGLPAAPEHQRRPSAPKRERNAGMFAPRLEKASATAVSALRMLCLSGWRENEVLRLKWSEVNLKTGIATLGDTKTGKSVRALGEPVLNLLAAQPRVQGSPYVFPSPRDPSKPIEGVRRLWHSVRHECGLEGVRMHDLRHSVAAHALGKGFSLYLVQRLLGHKSARSTERYAHLGSDVARLMADDVGATIRDALDAHPAVAADVRAALTGKRRA